MKTAYPPGRAIFYTKKIQWQAEACQNFLQAFFMLVCKALQYTFAAVTPVWRS